MTLLEAAQEAINTLGYYSAVTGEDDQDTPAKNTMKALRKALEAEKQQEGPVAWFYIEGETRWVTDSIEEANNDSDGEITPLYIHPQPVQQPLTDEQILRHITCSPLERAMFLRFARAIERAHHITGETK
jgi:hypothetical protein